MQLAEEYTVADGLVDLADLVEVLGSHESIRNLSDAYLQLRHTSGWFGLVTNFIRSLNGSMAQQVTTYATLITLTGT